MSLANHTRVSRRDGKLVIEIAEARILAAAAELLAGRATLTNSERLLDHVATNVTRVGRSARGGGEPPLDQLIGNTLAEAAHARAGLEWNDPIEHTLVHE